jgi:hypothetical protein
MQTAQNCQLYAVYFSLPIIQTIFVVTTRQFSLTSGECRSTFQHANLSADMAVVYAEYRSWTGTKLKYVCAVE